MLSLADYAKLRHCDHRGGCPQSIRKRKLKAATPYEPAWLSFGIIICFSSYDCILPCINMFNVMARARHGHISLKIQMSVVILL